MISQKARYSFKALTALARAAPGETVQTRQIAEQENIPRAFLEQILLELKRNRLVTSRRGKEGGYFLSRSPEEISIGQVLRATDGPIAPLSCLSRHSYRRCEDCPDEAACALRAGFAEAFSAQLEVLEKISLASAMRHALEAKANGAAPDMELYMGAGI
ncbi:MULTISPECIES: Rrf2 family transcriptional regulator [unclassified Beijerinckia]|uniref:RrF2 family transcriptional regulator n=1 Tax=unclassified Beijerinckia TaxID=2638183 RepID=UPI00089C7C4C|nr:MULTISPECIES: Rrf2 family transcriptional regulator [unclassified Beijerinckia]MDH7796539.1 Rrf2 family protein [Beijerinckia sp. GAS462]SEC49371.1 transcriptional regulator, BadM/Rrf2 family [Beijerinckia sp. 28-YEA-48]